MFPKMVLSICCLAASTTQAMCPRAYYDNARARVVLPLVEIDARAHYRVELEVGTDRLQVAVVEPAQGGMDRACTAHFESAGGWLEVPEINLGGDYFRARLRADADYRFPFFDVETVPLAYAVGLPNRPAAVVLPRIEADRPGEFEAVPAFPALPDLTQPVLLTQTPRDSRFYVMEQKGRIVAFVDDANVDSYEVFLDISDKILSGGEQGLLGLAFDPEFARNGYFYIYYSADDPRRSVIARYHAVVLGGGGENLPPPRAEPGSEKILLEIPQPYSNHNAGMIAFGPDGMLYIALGDGGSGGDPQGHGQNRATLLGSILRIDPHGGEPYAIPPDNPFVGESGDVRKEIWAYGLRNPFRFSFDRVDGTLWAGDVGQNSFEEVDIIVRGGNYGWKIFEGNQSYANPDGLPATDFIAPVIDYERDLGVSVTGGYVYRGSAMPALYGVYIYGDFGSGRIWALRYRDGEILEHKEIANVPQISSFGEDLTGELYVVSYSGQLYRLQTAARALASLPEKLSETGLFTDTAALQPHPGLIEYEVNSPLWSDGTHKRRWLALPESGQIGFHPDAAWEFPVGTILVKHFELELEPGNPASAWRLETRVLTLSEEGWEPYTYKWNAAKNDADLLDTGLSETFTIQDPGTGTRLQQYDYPGRNDCLRCHNYSGGGPLGVNTRQLNRDFIYPAGTDNQLRAFAHAGLFTASVGAHQQYPALADPLNFELPAESRARAYLDANCAFCHHPGGPVPVQLDLRYTTPVADMGVINVLPQSMPTTTRYLVTPGEPHNSVLYLRTRNLDTQRMPPVGSRVVDAAGSGVLAEWIRNIPQ